MKKLGAILFGLALTGTLVYDVSLRQLKRRLIAQVEESCETCKLEIESIHFSPLSGTFAIRNSTFSWGDPESTGLNVELPRIEASFDFLKLFAKELHFREVRLRTSRFVITEGPRKLPTSRPRNEQPSAWTVAVDSTRIVDAAFRYTRNYGERHANINVSQIQASIGQWGTVRDLLGKTTEGEVEGLLERSGRFNLKVTKPLFVEGAPLALTLKIEGQRLAELNSFFRIDSGIQLSGTVLRGKSNVVVHGKRLKGASEIQYEDFNIQFEKYRDRSALSALFGNLGKSLTIGHDLPQLLPREMKLTSVELERRKEETLIQFILHGMKDSALKVTALRKPKSDS